MSEQQHVANNKEAAGFKKPPLLPLPPPPTLLSPPPQQPHVANIISNNSSGGGGGLLLGGLSSLPPPPTLITPRGAPSSTTTMPSSSSSAGGAVNGIGGSAASAAATSATTSTLPTQKPPSLPPPPIVSSSSLPPPPTVLSRAAPPPPPPTTINSVNSGESNLGTDSNSNSKRILHTQKSIHSTTEQIPPLASAPNSGYSMYKEESSEEEMGEDQPRQYQQQQQQQQQQPWQNYNTTTTANANANNLAAADIFAQPATATAAFSHPPPPNQQQQQQQSVAQQHFQQQSQQASSAAAAAPPTSGSSWTAWAGSMAANVNTAAIMGSASASLEKAGQLAYSTVESAADLVVQSGGGTGSGSGSLDNSAALDMVGVSPGTPGLNSFGVGISPGGPATAAAMAAQQRQQQPGGAVKDNFANLFIGGSPGHNGEVSSNNTSAHAESRNKDGTMAEMMATPDSSTHPFPSTHSIPAAQLKLENEQPPKPPALQPPSPVALSTSSAKSVASTTRTTATHPPKSSRRASSSPPPSTLASRQSRLPILILPTADAQSMATKNNTTLPELFRIYGNSRAQVLRTAAGRGGSADSSLEPMLPPFRSANRSMALSWENISLEFVGNDDMENCMPVGEEVMERGLGESARLWEEDRVAFGGNGVAGDATMVDGVEEEDAEMDRLEGYVVGALAEDEAEEMARKEDGMPSMTSSSPYRRNSQLDAAANDDNNINNGTHHEMPFPPQPEEALAQSSDAAFALTALPTSPWLLRFRHTLDCATNGIHHEMLCNPSVAILVASSSEMYVNCLAELANVHHLPRPYHDGRYDPNGLRREFLLLHDAVNGPKDFDEPRALHLMRERFGYGCCSVLRINSLIPRTVAISDGYATAGEDGEWEAGGPPSPFCKRGLTPEYRASIDNPDRVKIRGACLSPSDKRAIRRYVANMVATGLVPAVERRIAYLNSAVTNAKKGVKNVIKSFWRKPKESMLGGVVGYNDGTSGSGGGNIRRDKIEAEAAASGTGITKYRHDSIESQTRLLADTLFLMRDYEAALSSYRLVKDDYKHDKAHLHYASVQEMMVLCMYMLDPSGRDGRYSNDVHHSIETALYSYTRASDEEKESDANAGGVQRPGKAPYATRLATRLCLALSASRSLCEGKHMEIADLLASASSHETPLGAAILLEQSSAHYYRAGMLRKYAFHMLMAGHMFRSAQQERHAFRCFAASLYVYHGERWGELRSHLRSALAAQLYGMGRYALSMQFYAKLIAMTGGGRVSVRSQQKFLNHIVTICKEHQSSALVAIDRMNESDTIADGSAPNCADDVLKGFTNAVRQIEISNIGFPHVQDSSIRICVDSAGFNSCVSLGRSDSTPIDGAADIEEESVWQDMKNCAEAELRASAAIISSTAAGNNNSSNHESSHDDSPPDPPSTHSGDQMTDEVIEEIDKEEREVEYRERQKRKGNVRTPEARATSEPLAVTFSLKNPLGLDIELKDMQLVASMSCSKTGLQHTNEFSVAKEEGSDDSMAKKNWTFHGSEDSFHNPQFMCQLPSNSDTSEASASAIDESSGPYFVVTKSSVKMGPNSDTVANLKICPLVEGELRIIGVRFHLLGEVWIYHRFDLPGPLLQDTQVNRSKRIRGESLLLRSKVEQEMPSLKVTLAPDESTQSTVLQGQTSRWKLTLTNVGYAPASNIMLKTNAPWLNMTQFDETSSEDASTSYCVGPSGTLMRVPLSSANQLDILQPGQTVEVPVAIRTSGGGRQDFYMLFRYELWSDDNSTSSLVPRHRWARKLLSVPVYPSITMSASLMPSFSNKGEHILSVELMNYRSDRETKLEIHLDKICIASRHFEIRQLLGQVDSHDLSNPLITSSGDPVSSLKIGWQERVTLHYLVVPIERSNSSVTFSTLTFSSGNKPALESLPEMSRPYGAQVTDFMCCERAHDTFNSTLQSHRIEKEQIQAEQEKEGQPRHVAQIRRARTSLPEQESNISSDGQSQVSNSALIAHPTSLASLCPVSGGSNINIICCWSAIVGNDGIDDNIHGQHHLRNLLVRPLNKSKGCPLALTAKYKSKVLHNFEDPLDEDVEITIRNRLIETEVEFEFAIDHQPGFDFVGTTCFNWLLVGGDEISVPLKARIYSGGIYNLQSVRLTVLKNGTSIPYLFPLQWTMVAEDCA